MVHVIKIQECVNVIQTIQARIVKLFNVRIVMAIAYTTLTNPQIQKARKAHASIIIVTCIVLMGSV